MSFILYVKDGCELCEQFLQEMSRSRPDLIPNVDIVDIHARPVLLDRYGDKIPVLTQNGRIMCQYYFDEVALNSL